MPGLSGFTSRQVIRKPRRVGFEFDRHAKGSHEIWINRKTRRRTTVPNRPGDMAEGTLRAIIRQAGLTREEFLRL